MYNHRRRVRTVIAFATVLIVALGTACGSNLSRQQLAAANGALQLKASASGGAAGGASVGSADQSDSGDPSAAAGGAAGGAGGSVTGGSSSGGGATGGGSTGAGGAVTGGAGGASASGRSGGTGGAGVAVGGGCTGTKSVINLGSFGDASGVLGAVSGPAPPANRAWAKWINANGGLNCHPVNMTVADDGGDPARALSIAQQMVEQNHVVAIFNEFTFGELDGALPYLTSKGVPVLGTIGAALSSDHSAMVFNPSVGADLGQAWGFILTIAAQTQASKISVLYCREAATCTQQYNSFKALLPYKGINIAYAAQVSLVQPDFTAELLGAKNAGAQVVVALVDSASLIRMAQNARTQGWNPQLAGTYNLQIDATLQGKNDLNGLILAARSAPYQTSPKLANYRQAMAQYGSGAPLGDVGSGAFVMGDLLQKVAPALGDNPTSASLISAMHSLHGETLGGLLPGITFPQGNDHTHNNECIVPIVMKNGQFISPNGADAFACAPDWHPGT